jgi:hypothetical protein
MKQLTDARPKTCLVFCASYIRTWSKIRRHQTLQAQRFLDRFPNGLGQENQHVLSLAFLKLHEVLKI